MMVQSMCFASSRPAQAVDCRKSNRDATHEVKPEAFSLEPEGGSRNRKAGPGAPSRSEPGLLS